MRTPFALGLACAALLGCGDEITQVVRADAGPEPSGDFLPLGQTLACGGSQKVTGIVRQTGDLICGDDVDTDTNTLYTPGPGMAVDGTTLSVSFADFTCGGSDKMIGFAAGAPMCQPDQRVATTQVPRNNTVTTVDDESNTGKHVSLTIGADGLPVMSYRDSGGSGMDLRVAKCRDPGCVAPAAITVVDATDDVGDHSAMAIGIDGLPVISYYDQTNTALKVAKCVDPACAMPANIHVVDAGGVDDVGQRTSIAVGVDGLPIISYYDASNGDLKFAHCTDTECSTGTSTIGVLDGLGAPDVGGYNELAIGTDGRPIVAYYNATDSNLWVARCGDAACSAGNVNNVVDDGTITSVGRYVSLTIGVDGIPVISYRDSGSGGLLVVRCADTACTPPAPARTLVDAAGTPDVQDTSITIGMDGLPIVAYYDGVSAALRVAKCGDAGCAAGNTLVTLDTGFVGEYPSITVGIDGRPLIAYRGSNNLRVAQCANPLCLAYWTRR